MLQRVALTVDRTLPMCVLYRWRITGRIVNFVTSVDVDQVASR